MASESGICNRRAEGATLRWRALFVCFLVLAAIGTGAAQNQFEKRRIAKVEIAMVGSDALASQIEQYRLTARDVVGTVYSTPRIREAILALYRGYRIDTISVAAALDAAGDVELTFSIKRKTEARRVSVVVGEAIGDSVTEEDILFKLNLLTPGTVITEQTLRNNADEILDYLRDRGFYKSEVTYDRQSLPNTSDIGVTFRIEPRAQATVENFRINITGYNKPIPLKSLKLEPGKEYSRDRLTADVTKIRSILKEDDLLAPTLEEPAVTYDSDKNTIAITLTGTAGPKVGVVVETKQETVSERTQNNLLPVRREGTLDYAAIIEGARRLENYYQERGYFFATVESVCSVKPPVVDPEGTEIANGTDFLCSVLSGENLTGREVEVKYRVNLDRRLRLTELRLTGTSVMTIEDVRPVLGSQKANILAIVPILGYGRGYTSARILAEDRNTIQSLMQELGYRDATVRVDQGVSVNGEDLIITFVVEEGLPYVVNDVSIIGNSAVPTAELRARLPVLTGRNYSRARERSGVTKLREYYSNEGYYDAKVTSKMIESSTPAAAGKKDVTIEYKIENERKKVRINRVLVDGNESTKTGAILKAVTLEPGELLKSADVYSSEQNLYSSDVFSRVDIKPQPAGDGPDNTRLSDVLVSVTEQPARIMSYGGGASTDRGLSGFFDIRHLNLFGNLWQGGARVEVSQRQQLVQFDFVNPRFLPDRGRKRFAPLTLSIQYQRDSTVTRFFRSAFDEGTFGIVQRLDEDGNPIDEFGRDVGSPTLNRLALSAETSRTISRKSRSIVFLKYRFEDVRLFKFESLLIKELLRPDSRTRISGFGVTFVRDTRQNCNNKFSLLDLIAKGEPDEPCRYNASDPTRGYFITADYNLSIPALGANVGFHKAQASVNYYYTFPILNKPGLRNTTLAARAIIGGARVFSGGDRFTGSQFPFLNGLLPISERFFGGGSTTLRGFDFEQAGPRVVIVPQGVFRNSQREPVFLDPFTIPFGGNGLAVVNIEARVPFSDSLRVVPFYDGGNVFRKAGDIFKAPPLPAANDIAGQNQRAVWTHSVGLGLRVKTPVGGEFAIDFARLLNPPSFFIPQATGPNAVYRLGRDQMHFRFSQAF